MTKIDLRKIKPSDKKYFSRWWRDKELISLTSGDFDELSDVKINSYFKKLFSNNNNFHFMIDINNITIGHIALVKVRDGNYETQIIIGEEKFRNQGFGSKAIKLLLQKISNDKNVKKIFLEVRPSNLRAIRAYEKAGFIKGKTKKYPKNPNLPKVLVMNYIKA